MENPFNFHLTEELKRCDDRSKEAVNFCLAEAMQEIVTSAIFYTGRHNARKNLKETDVKLAITLYLRTLEHRIEVDHLEDTEQYMFWHNDDIWSGLDRDSDDSEDSDTSDSEESTANVKQERKRYPWEKVNWEETSDGSDNEPDPESAQIDSENENNFRRPDEIATESRWLYNLKYDYVQAAVWQECSTKLDVLTNYFRDLIAAQKATLHNELSGGDGFDSRLMFDTIVVFLPLLCFLTWNATLAIRGDRRR